MSTATVSDSTQGARVDSGLIILERQPIPTWFRCGGGAQRLCRPVTGAQLREALAIDPRARVLGDGANLLVADRGVAELVIDLAQGEASRVRVEGETVVAGAGARLPQLIHATHKQGLCGLETLGGIPASVGGACVMNAGGAFGQIGDYVHAVRALDRGDAPGQPARELRLKRERLRFDYRRAMWLDERGAWRPLVELVVEAVELRLTPGDAAAARARLIEVMDYKKRTQPMAAHSAGCTFKNPTLGADLDGIGAAGARVSAGLLIDRAGCKGLRAGGAQVSGQHANFFATDEGCRADDVLALMAEVTRRVHERFGVRLQPEVVVWGAPEP